MYKSGWDPRQHVEDGRGIQWWTRLYFDYTTFIMSAPVRFAWPEGKPVEQQPNFLVEMFREIDIGMIQEMKNDA